jgi:hypothetical protein
MRGAAATMNTAMMTWPMKNMAGSPRALRTYGRRPRLILGPLAAYIGNWILAIFF